MERDSPLFEPMIELLRSGAFSGGWSKAVFSKPREGSWDRLAAEPIQLAPRRAMRLTRHAGGRSTTTTVRASAWATELDGVLSAGPGHINVLSAEGDWHARHTKSGRWLVTHSRPSSPRPASPAAHDREHVHPLPASDAGVRELFVATGIYGKSGRLLGDAAGKHRQVQHFVELLRPLELFHQPPGTEITIVDAGCGKAYLSLALYLHALRNDLRPTLHAVDREPGVIESVARAASELGFDGAVTHASTIAEFASSGPGRCDLLVSLHACDTASDEAIMAGLALDASAIVVAPCCHHELVAQIEGRFRAGTAPLEWAGTLASGILRHRLADLVTDSLRASALEARGYRASVLEFVDAEATSRNLMIRAERRPAGSGLESARRAGFERFRSLAQAWGVHPTIERVVGGSETGSA